MCVVKANVASEVWVADIPDDLPYAATSTWVNFRSGFLLAETLAPGSSRHMSFEQLLNLTAEHFRASGDDVKQQALVAAAKLGPTVQWAQANGLIASRKSGHSARNSLRPSPRWNSMSMRCSTRSRTLRSICPAVGARRRTRSTTKPSVKPLSARETPTRY